MMEVCWVLGFETPPCGSQEFQEIAFPHRVVLPVASGFDSHVTGPKGHLNVPTTHTALQPV